MEKFKKFAIKYGVLSIVLVLVGIILKHLGSHGSEFRIMMFSAGILYALIIEISELTEVIRNKAGNHFDINCCDVSFDKELNMKVDNG